MPLLPPPNPNAPRNYQPSFDFGLPRDYAGMTEYNDTESWERAPATSHIWGWRFTDARKVGVLKFGAPEIAGRSQLQVRFRDKSGKITSQYTYFFANHDEGEAYLQKMRGAAHPGHIIQELIAAQIPYTRT